MKIKEGGFHGLDQLTWNDPLVTWSGAPKLCFHKAFISTHIVLKFQLCMSSSFWVISELINFQAKNWCFFCFFLCLNLQSHDLGSPKLAHVTLFTNSFVESKFQLSRFYCLLVISNWIVMCQNPQKHKGTTCSCKVPYYKANGSLRFWEKITANNFYLRHCVDLKPVRIIRCIVQFGFRIVWDSNPSGFVILKCSSLIAGCKIVMTNNDKMLYTISLFLNGILSIQRSWWYRDIDTSHKSLGIKRFFLGLFVCFKCSRYSILKLFGWLFAHF